MRVSGKQKEISNGGLRTRISLMEVFYNCCIASGGLRTVLLQTIGFNAGQIGLVSSLCSATNIVAPPVWGTIADKIHSYSKCFIICLLVSAILMALIPVTAPFLGSAAVVVTILLVADSLFSGPANNMSELWLVQIGNSGRGISYGSVRLWASLGYAAMGGVYTYLLGQSSVYIAYILYGVFAVPALLLALSLTNVRLSAEVQTEKRQRFRDLPFREMLSPAVILYTVFTCVLNAVDSGKHTYFIYVLGENGFGNQFVGLFMAVSACCEVPTLFFSQRVIKKVGLFDSILVCIVAEIVENLLYVLGHTLLAVSIGQILKGLGAGLMMSARIQYTYNISPKGLEATTNTLIGSCSAITSIIVMSFSGFLLEAVGVRTFYTLIAVGEAVSVLFLLMTKRSAEKTPVLRG